jgi:hypothetical protein
MLSLVTNNSKTIVEVAGSLAATYGIYKLDAYIFGPSKAKKHAFGIAVLGSMVGFYVQKKGIISYHKIASDAFDRCLKLYSSILRK